MRKLVLLSLLSLLWAGGAIAARPEPRFDAESPKGILFRNVVPPETMTLTVAPVDLDANTVGKPITLDTRGEWNIAGKTGLPGWARKSYFTGHNLEPGDYAVIAAAAKQDGGFTGVNTTVCYLHLAPVLSIRAGQATMWRITPVQATTWTAYAAGYHKPEQYAAVLEPLERVLQGYPNLQPSKLTAVPGAFVDLSGGEVVDARICVPKGMRVVHRSDEAGGG